MVANQSVSRNYICPNISNNKILEITGGRHPVVEHQMRLSEDSHEIKSAVRRVKESCGLLRPNDFNFHLHRRPGQRDSLISQSVRQAAKYF